MEQGKEIIFKLSIWRPAQLNRLMDYPSAQFNENHIQFDPTLLQEQIYYWDPGGVDFYGCINNYDQITKLKDFLIRGFAPELPIEDRFISKLKDVVGFLKNNIFKKDYSTWMDTMQTIDIDGEEEINIRSNPIIPFLHHLDWIVKTFGDIPGASVKIR